MNPLIVANNILYLAFQENRLISPMKLQRLLYFVYRDYIKNTNKPLFSEKFQAWKYGPVLYSVYSYFNRYGSNKITEYYKNDSNEVYIIVHATLNEILLSVWEKYKFYDGISLSKLTQKQGAAWYQAWTANKFFLNNEY